MAGIWPIVAFLFAVCLIDEARSAQYLGKFIGKLSELNHGVSGEVYAVDGRTLHIKDFTYDGQGPAAYFYASTHKAADKNGFRLRDENGKGQVIRRYRKEGITLTLPEGKTLNNIKIFYVWCEEFDVNFGDVKIPRNFEYPRPQKIDRLNGVHSITSDNIVIVDAQTLLIPNLSYDGEAPDAKFWVGRGTKPSPQGIRVPDENGKELPLRRYDRKTVVLTLPGGLTVFDIGHFGIWCEKFTVDFGHVVIPHEVNVPPSLKMLGVSPQKRQQSDISTEVSSQSRPRVGGHLRPTTFRPPSLFSFFNRRNDAEQQQHDLVHRAITGQPQQNTLQLVPAQQVYHESKLNCEVLFDELAFEVRWAVAGESIVLQLVAKLGDGEYMSFGLSGDQSKSVMIGGDVAVAWVDKQTLKGYAEDYYLADKSQCSGPTGSCPDRRLAEYTNNVRLLNAAMVNGYSIVTYQRPLKASDRYDLQIITNHSQPIIWAIGPLNQRNEVSFHSSYLKKDNFIDFGRPARWNCPMPETDQPPMVPIQTSTRSRFKEDPVFESESATTSAPKRNTNRRRGGSRRPQQNQDNDSDKSASRGQHHHRRGAQSESESSLAGVSSHGSVAKRDAWVIPPIECYEPEDGVFYAQLGPTGGKKGYPAVTGHVGWGISWYINGLLIPEINVVRGKTYTFVVEGGEDPEVSAKYHPFYITDDPVGGYEYKTAEERKQVRIFAGVRLGKDGTEIPTGTGRLCHWSYSGDREADDFESFGAFQRFLELKCDVGEPGVIQWTPDKNTPDTVYYQCFTHRYLGWKINVHDSCDGQPDASEIKSVVIPAPAALIQDKSDIDLDDSPSMRIETRVNPNNFIKEDKEDIDIKSTVSEKKIIPSTLDPLPTTRQPQAMLPTEPILVLPLQSYFDPFYQSKGPNFPHYTYNPYQFGQLQHQSTPDDFKPSQFLNTVKEPQSPEYTKATGVVSTTTTTVPTTTTKTSSTSTRRYRTTTSTSTSTEVSNIIKGVPKTAENAVAPSNYFYNQTYYIRPSAKPYKFNNVVLRRPNGYPYGYQKRPQVLLRKPNFPPMRQFSSQQKPFKNQIIRSPVKIISNNRPYNFELDSKPIFLSQIQPERQLPPPIFVSQPTSVITRSPPLKNHMINVVVSGDLSSKVRNVEISPQQASTEREPEIQTAPSTSVLDITPMFIRPAYNTGFKPGSIKIESGFKPIVSKEFQDRMDKDEPDIEYESEVGVVNIEDADQYEFKPIQSFEPMFVPSPTDKTVKEKKLVKIHKRPLMKKYYPYTKIVIKQPRSIQNFEEEPVAEAAERVETYYLPPSDNKEKPVDNIRKPSNIDFEAPDSSNLNIASPPDIVVTYDGKKVSGQSLTAKLSDRSSILDQRASKASEFIKAMPQFGKFKGELPPLNPDFIDKNAPQLQTRSGVLSRELDTPLPSSPSYLPQGITRLSRVRQSREILKTRMKRAAHHTPEHTAEQEAEMRRNSTQANNSSNSLISSLNVYISIIIVVAFFKYL